MLSLNLFKSQPESSVSALVRKIPATEAPPGWVKVVGLAVGGLWEVGFSRHTNLLLVVSSSGRCVINCATGEKCARDYVEDGDWYEPASLTCLGIGALADEIIPISGLCGGGLPTVNIFGESLEHIAPDWPEERVIFCPPGRTAFIETFQSGCCVLATEIDIRAAGFSWNGQYLVIATSSDLHIWQRVA